jgi:hypothetical protein
MADSDFITRFFALDRQLAAKNHPALSPFWKLTFRRFLSSTCRQLTVRAGRRSGKSLNACRLAVGFALLHEWNVPAGETAACVIVSVSLAEARAKIAIVRSMLSALGCAVARDTADEIQLRDLPICFKAIASNFRTVVGFSSVIIVADEVARWRDDVSGANPASEILSSLRPTMATHPNARLLLISSPLGSTDYHAESFDKGNTDQQQVAHAPTWVGNPTITEADTHALEPDPRIHAREYAALPQAGLLSCFEAGDVARAFEPRGDIGRRFGRVGVVDASSGKADVFAYAVAGWSEIEGSTQHVLEFDHVGGFSARDVASIGIEQVISRIGQQFRDARVHAVFGDQRESMMIGAAFRRERLRFIEFPWTAPAKARGVARVRRLLLEGRLVLPPWAPLRRELLTFEEKIDSSGQITFAGHTGDHLSTLITCALADEARHLPGSDVAHPPENIDPNRFVRKDSWGNLHARTDAAEVVQTAEGVRFLPAGSPRPREQRRDQFGSGGGSGF